MNQAKKKLHTKSLPILLTLICLFLSGNLNKCAVSPGLIFITAFFILFFLVLFLFFRFLFPLAGCLLLMIFNSGSRLLKDIKLRVARKAN